MYSGAVMSNNGAQNETSVFCTAASRQKELCERSLALDWQPSSLRNHLQWHFESQACAAIFRYVGQTRLCFRICGMLLVPLALVLHISEQH